MPIARSVLRTRAVETPHSSFFTDFAGSENPLSENGAWNPQPAATVFTNAVKKVSGLAFDAGTATGFNDAIATLVAAAFTPTRRLRITATLSVTGAFGSSEVELHFNGQFTSTTAKLYEFDLTGGGVLAVKWNGTQGDIFFPLHTVTGGAVWANSNDPQTGDKVKIERTDDGTTLTFNVWHIPFTDRGAQLAGVPFLMLTCTDSLAISGSAIYITGQPGMGFDNGGAQNGNFALTDYLVENF